MSLESIKLVTEAENTAKAALESAKTEARSKIADATAQGKKISEEAKERARNENKRLLAQAEEMAAVETKATLEKTASQCEAVEAKAQAKLEAAAGIIVERIVNG